MRIAVKEVGKELEIIESNEKYITDCAKRYIGENNIVEFVRINEDGSLYIGVNEDGLRLELPLNFLTEVPYSYWPVQKMVGTAVFMRRKTYLEDEYDFKVEDLTDSDIEHIKKILSREYQEELSSNFRDYGKGECVIQRIL